MFCDELRGIVLAYGVCARLTLDDYFLSDDWLAEQFNSDPCLYRVTQTEDHRTIWWFANLTDAMQFQLTWGGMLILPEKDN